MSSITERAEREASYRQWAERLGRLQGHSEWGKGDGPGQVTSALTHAASQAARNVGASAILCCTRSGRTARAMARFRPDVPMLALSPDAAVLRTLALSWGVEPIEVGTYGSTDDMVWFAVERALAEQLIARGEIVLVLAGSPGQRAEHESADVAHAVATDVLRIVSVR